MRKRLNLSILHQIGSSVAGRAIAIRNWPGCRSMIHRRWRPDRVAADMTDITLAGGRDMGRGLGQGINRCIASAMTDTAIAHSRRPGSTGMVGYRWRKGIEIGVTDITSCRRRNMAGRLAQALAGSAVVTRGAACMGANHHTGMTKYTSSPSRIIS